MNRPRKYVELNQKELPVKQRPRTRILEEGPERLSDAELLAVIITCGGTQAQALAVSSALLELENGKLSGFMGYASEEYKRVGGIGNVRSSILCACMELSKRIWQSQARTEFLADCPEKAAAIFMEDMRHLKKEVLKVALINVKCELMSVETVSMGGLAHASSDPREVFSLAVKKGASGIILAHNHPSGDPAPSPQDLNVTKQLKEAGNIIGIALLDHIIIGDGRFSSLKEMGAI